MKKTLNRISKAVMAFAIISVPFISNAQLKVSGLLFGDYAYKLHSDSVAGRTSKAQYANRPGAYQGFDIRRAYLGVDYDISPKVHAQVLLAHESDVTLTQTATAPYTALGNRTFYLKAANIRIKDIFKGSDFIIGQQNTPTFATNPGSETVWGYRSIEKTVMDMRGIASSADLGISLEGKYMDGNFGYNIMYGNNNGAKLEVSPSTSADNAHRLYADVYYRFLNKQFIVQLYGDYSGSDSTKNTKIHGAYKSSNTTFKAFVAYTGSIVTLGVEGFTQTKKNGALDASNALRDANPFGYSVFARATILKDKDTSKATNKGDLLSVFARYDSWDPDTKLTGDLVSKSSAPGESFITAGIDWTIAKNVHLMPNIWINNYHAKTGSKYTTDRSDSDMVGRVTFFWKF